MTFPLTRRIYIYFTRQTCLTLPNVFNTSTFIKHKPTGTKIFTFLTLNGQKGLGKIINIKVDQADLFKIAGKKIFFSFFTLKYLKKKNFTIDQSPKASIFVKGSSIS